MGPRSFAGRFAASAAALLCLAGALGAAGACSSSSSPGPATSPEAGGGLVVALGEGQVQADLVGGTRRFLKIPYAKPPVGDLRWKAPVRNDPWMVVRHETSFSDACPQTMSQQGPASNAEDCLYLNVWAPEPAPSKAPVMVWFHGGGNFAGSTHDNVPTTQQLWYDGQFFAARHGIVVVSANYRLGPMGFFAHPALAAEHSPLGNQGLFDQRAALQWVQRNVAAFGGDPGNVTIFGESAGSADVCYHVVSGVEGLFQRAVSESGGCSTSLGGTKERTSAEAASGILAFTKTMGCDTAADALACLRGKSAADIMTNAPAPNLTGGTMVTTPFSFGAVVDGPGGFLADQPRTLMDSGKVVHVPYILGSNNDEGMLFLLNATIPTSDAEYLAALQTNFGTFAPQVMAQYPVSKFGGDYRLALANAIGDSGLICGTHDTARRLVKAGLNAFMYNFNIPWAIDPPLLASHASEISHVFGNPVKPMPDSKAVSDAMNAFWAHFAKTGDPNYPGAPATWPAFAPDTNDDDLRLQLDPGWEKLQSFRKQECAFWRAYFDQGFAGARDAGLVE